jgi:hypothetical protein
MTDVTSAMQMFITYIRMSELIDAYDSMADLPAPIYISETLGNGMRLSYLCIVQSRKRIVCYFTSFSTPIHLTRHKIDTFTKDPVVHLCILLLLPPALLTYEHTPDLMITLPAL